MTSEVETTELRGPLPEDFPGRSSLEAAGITTYGKLRMQRNLKDITGIGDVMAMKIKDRLEEDALAAKHPREEAPAESIAPRAGDGQTQYEPPASPVRVVCPVCGVGGEVAGEALVGTATCGNPKHPDQLLVRA